MMIDRFPIKLANALISNFIRGPREKKIKRKKKRRDIFSFPTLLLKKVK